MPLPIIAKEFDNIIPKATVFRLWVLTTYNYDDDDNVLPRYPECDADQKDLGLYSTVQNAEKVIQEYEWDDECDIIGFKITELGIDMPLGPQLPITERSYNHKREKIDEVLINQNWVECFRGRPKDKIRFKVGDFVEYFCYDKLQLCIVACLPLTPEDGYLGDATDDAYTVLPVSDDDFNHSHPSPCDLFGPREAIPEEIQTHLRGRLERYLAEE